MDHSSANHLSTRPSIRTVSPSGSQLELNSSSSIRNMPPVQSSAMDPNKRTGMLKGLFSRSSAASSIEHDKGHVNTSYTVHPSSKAASRGQLSVISDNPDLEIRAVSRLSMTSRKNSLSPSVFSIGAPVTSQQHNSRNGSPAGSLLGSVLRLPSSASIMEERDPTAPNGPLGETQPSAEGKPHSCVPRNCCSKTVRKICLKVFAGIVITLMVTCAWVGATQFLKESYEPMLRWDDVFPPNGTNATSSVVVYDAPFFTTWFCSMGTILFLPLYLIFQLLTGTKKSSLKFTLKESMVNLREKGFTLGKFVSRCCLFSLLWVLTNYLYIHSLRILGCTEVMALFATNACFVYLLSWVVLHDQFVGIRIVAVILSNTGIALLAYMDGINQTPTLGGVVLAAAAAAGSAVYKVFFKRVMGDVTFCQVAIFFTLIGLTSALLFWPFILLFYFTGIETIPAGFIPWRSLFSALALSLAANLLANFGIVVTYETFITLGLLLAVPTCAVIDIWYYHVIFSGMKLAGIIMIVCGFVLVLFPNNWPDLIHKIIRLSRRSYRGDGGTTRKPPPDLRTGHIGSRLRSPSGRVK